MTDEHYPIWTDDAAVPIACSACSTWPPETVLVTVESCPPAKERLDQLSGWMHGEGIDRPAWLDEVEQRILRGEDPPWWAKEDQ